MVDVKDTDGRELARGLVAYAADDARRIAGRKSGEIEKLLGFRGRDEIVHRDDSWSSDILSAGDERSDQACRRRRRRSWPSSAGARRPPPWRCAMPTTDAKNKALTDGARLIRAEKAAILAANARDIDGGQGRRHDRARCRTACC